jgi:hypothetical protein
MNPLPPTIAIPGAPADVLVNSLSVPLLPALLLIPLVALVAILISLWLDHRTAADRVALRVDAAGPTEILATAIRGELLRLQARLTEPCSASVDVKRTHPDAA